MNLFGRISVCGAISGYNEKGLPKGESVCKGVQIHLQFGRTFDIKT